VNKLQKREGLERELKDIQLSYYGYQWHSIFEKFNQHNQEYLEVEAKKREKEKRISALNEELNKLEAQGGLSQEYNQYQSELSQLQQAKDEITGRIAKIDAQIEVDLESQGKFDISWLLSKKEEVNQAVAKIESDLSNIDFSVLDKERRDLAREKENISTEIERLNKKIFSSDFSGYGHLDRSQALELKELADELSQAEEASDISQIKKAVKKAKTIIQKIIKAHNPKEAKEEMDKIREKILELTKSKESVSARLTQVEFEISSKKEKQRIVQEEKTRLQDELAKIDQKIKTSQNQISSQELKQQKEKLCQELSEIESKLKAARQRMENISKQEEEKRSKLFSTQRSLQEVQSESNELGSKLSELKIYSTRYETKLEDLEAEIRQSLGGLREVKEQKEQGEVDVEQARDKIHSIKKQLEQIGGIDPEVENEYAETKERYDFLSGQVNDLKEAINSLEKIIQELDATIKDRFDKEFKLIQDKFQEYFKILFNGGSAKILKVMDNEEEKEGAEENDGLERQKEEQYVDVKKIKFLQKHNATGLAGIEIQATPPGKKIKSISMLSGGERALTAIALICAIISANPSPFVVLDEVDAALDEANSERLAKILDDLSHKTQFIVITHNRASMRKANVLYGVTMGDDGVSKLLSVKLDDVKVK
jgi:chromosome segregation protein